MNCGRFGSSDSLSSLPATGQPKPGANRTRSNHINFSTGSVACVALNQIPQVNPFAGCHWIMTFSLPLQYWEVRSPFRLVGHRFRSRRVLTPTCFWKWLVGCKTCDQRIDIPSGVSGLRQHRHAVVSRKFRTFDVRLAAGCQPAVRSAATPASTSIASRCFIFR